MKWAAFFGLVATVLIVTAFFTAFFWALVIGFVKLIMWMAI